MRGSKGVSPAAASGLDGIKQARHDDVAVNGKRTSSMRASGATSTAARQVLLDHREHLRKQ